MVVAARLAIPVLVAGCSFSELPPRGGGGDDAGDGVRCEDWTFTPAEVMPCDLPKAGRVVLTAGGTYVLSSEDGTLTGPGGATAMLPYIARNGIGIVSVVGLDVPVGTTLRAKGMLPLVVASWTTITVAGTVSVASFHPDPAGAPKNFDAGAGAGAPQCPSGAAAPQRGTPDNAGDDGGGGGGFAAPGGKGGDGGGGGGAGGGTGGMARTRPSRIEGGCDGAAAAAGTNGIPGSGGPGGGAIALIAKDAVTILDGGIVEAGGAGGNGGDGGQTGGGGGGAGGMIKLETRDLRVAPGATLAANGGQGGGGANNNRASPGIDGRPDALPAISTNREGGGSSDGGAGGQRLGHGGVNAASANDGGGGGGGAVGYIVYKAYGSAARIEQGATISPDAVSY